MFLKILMVAGSDTTSVVLAAITFYLVSNPEYLQIAFNEVRGILRPMRTSFLEHDSAAAPTYRIVLMTVRSNATRSFFSLTVVPAVRLCPPVPGILPREVMHQGVVIDGEPIPKGVSRPKLATIHRTCLD